MRKKYYYALFDDQIGQIVSTGFNETSKNLIRKHLINFLLLGNFSEEGENSIKKNTLTELVDYYEFSLLKSDVPFEDCKHYDLNLYRAWHEKVAKTLIQKGYIPNYPYDDEGLPTSTAGGIGDKGDIECYEDINGILIEVTMSEGRIQTVMEVWPIARHLEEFFKSSQNSMCYFVAPSIFKDSKKQIEYVKEKDNLNILPKTIEEFLEHINNKSVLYCIQ